MELLSPEEETAFRRHTTVARWIRSTTDSQIAPRRDWPQRLAYLKRFCDHMGTDPDRMTEEAIADEVVKKTYLREMKQWITAQSDLSERRKHEAENMLRHYFMKQGFRMLTKPFADVYNRLPNQGHG